VVGDLVGVLVRDGVDVGAGRLGGEGQVGLVDAGDQLRQELVTGSGQQEQEAVAAAAGQVGGREVADKANSKPGPRLPG